MKLCLPSQNDEAKPTGVNIAQVMMLVRMLRLVRILRLVKLIKSVRPLYILVTGVIAALQGVIWVLILTITVLYAAAILSTRLIGHGMLFSEGAVPDSMFTLFRVMSGAVSDDDTMALDSLMMAVPV